MVDRKRILVLTVSLMVAMLATFLITRGANQRYETASLTATAYEATGFLPIRSVLDVSNLKPVDVPASMAQGLAKKVDGKTLVTSVLPGDLIYANELSAAAPLPPGQVSLSVPVNQATADGVTAGDMVDVFAGNPDGSAMSIVADVEVLGSYDSQGAPVYPDSSANSGVVSSLKAPGGYVPSVVELMVPVGSVGAVVQNSKSVYLVRVK